MDFSDLQSLPMINAVDGKHYLLPEATLIRIIKCALLSSAFDERWYLEQYPDVLDALEKGELPSAFQHFIHTGFFEGRLPRVQFDEEFYLYTYNDVRQAVDQGYFESALEHFVTVGQKEGRVPSSVPRMFEFEAFVGNDASSPTPVRAKEFMRNLAKSKDMAAG